MKDDAPDGMSLAQRDHNEDTAFSASRGVSSLANDCGLVPERCTWNGRMISSLVYVVMPFSKGNGAMNTCTPISSAIKRYRRRDWLDKQAGKK